MIENALVQQAFQEIHTFVDLKLSELIPATPPAPAPSPAPDPGSWYIPTTVQLFGPVHANGAVTDNATTPKFIGNALSCSCHPMHFELPMAPIHSAYVRVIWAPGNAANYINVTSADDGPSNIQVLGVIQGANVATPVPGGVWITDQLKALQAAGVMKQIGFQLGGNGSAVTVYEVELQINFCIPKA